MCSSEARDLIETLRSKGMTMSAAESCTGGMLGASITSVPGASEVFLGSAVVYSNNAKMSILRVSGKTLEEHGAVSQETAREMAAGAARAYGSDIAVSITGIAGPGGATPTKPVGTVCFAVSDGNRTVAQTCRFDGDRESVRKQSVKEAMVLLKQFSEGIL